MDNYIAIILDNENSQTFPLTDTVAFFNFSSNI